MSEDIRLRALRLLRWAIKEKGKARYANASAELKVFIADCDEVGSNFVREFDRLEEVMSQLLNESEQTLVAELGE